MTSREFRRILLDGNAVDVTREGEDLIAGDGRRVAIADATHLPPVLPTKIICVHLNYSSRVAEMMLSLPPAPTYFHKPITALNAHEGAVVRPLGCKWLNYEGEIAIVIGRTARNISPDEAGDYIRGYTVGNDYGLHDYRDTARTRSRRGLGFPRQAHPNPRERRCAPGWFDGRDEVGHALSRRRHCPDHHPAPG